MNQRQIEVQEFNAKYKTKSNDGNAVCYIMHNQNNEYYSVTIMTRNEYGDFTHKTIATRCKHETAFRKAEEAIRAYEAEQEAAIKEYEADRVTDFGNGITEIKEGENFRYVDGAGNEYCRFTAPYGSKTIAITYHDPEDGDVDTDPEYDLENARSFCHGYANFHINHMGEDFDNEPEAVEIDATEKRLNELREIAQYQIDTQKCINEMANNGDIEAMRAAHTDMMRRVGDRLGCGRFTTKGYLYTIVHESMRVGNADVDIHVEDAMDEDILEDISGLVDCLKDHGIHIVTVSGYNALQIARSIIEIGGESDGLVDINGRNYAYKIPALRVKLQN